MIFEKKITFFFVGILSNENKVDVVLEPSARFIL